MAQDYPNRRGWFSRRGHCLFFGDNKDERLQSNAFVHRKGNQIIEHPDGSITIHATDGSTIQVLVKEKKVVVAQAGGSSVILGKTEAFLLGPKGDWIRIADGEIEVAAKTKIKFTAPSIELNAASLKLGLGAILGVMIGPTTASLSVVAAP